MDHLDVKIVVGKRYLSAKINENSIEYWQWNSGIIRAIELADNASSTSPPTLDYNTVSTNYINYKYYIIIYKSTLLYL